MGGAGVGSSGSGGQDWAFRIEGDGDSKIGNSSGDLHQITGTLAITGVISSSHGATLGNLILNDDARSLTLSGTISSSAGATFLGPMFTDDVNVSGTLSAATFSPSAISGAVKINIFTNKILSNNAIESSASLLAKTTVSGAGAGSFASLTTEEATISVAGAMSGAGLVSANALTTEEAAINVAGAYTGSGGIAGQSLTIANLAKVTKGGILSSSKGATLGNLILNDDATSLQVSGTISSSAGATLGNLILQDDATSLQLSGTLVAQKISSSVGSTLGNLILNDDSTSLQISGAAIIGGTAIYDPTGSSVTQITGTLDIKGWRVNAVTRTDLGTGTGTTITASTGLHFLDASDATAVAATGYHEIKLCTGSIDGQELKILVTGSLNAPTRLWPGASTKATGSITSTGVTANGQAIVLKGPGGSTSYTITALDDAGLPCGNAGNIDATNWLFGINGCSSAAENAAGIYNALVAGVGVSGWPFAVGDFTLGASTVISITASAGGATANQTTTENMANVTVAGMAGGSSSPSTVNTSYGVTFAGNQGAHLIFDVDSNNWQIIAGTQLSS